MMFARKNLKMNIVMTKNHVSVTYQNVIRAAIEGVQNPRNASKVNKYVQYELNYVTFSLIQLFSVKLPGCCQYMDISLQTCSKDAGNTDCNFGGGNITTIPPKTMCLKVLRIYDQLD